MFSNDVSVRVKYMPDQGALVSFPHAPAGATPVMCKNSKELWGALQLASKGEFKLTEEQAKLPLTSREEFIKQAIQDFLDNGGEITRIEPKKTPSPTISLADLDLVNLA